MSRVGIDIDGTVYPWTKAINQALKNTFGVEGLVEHKTWNYLEEHITPDQWRWCWSDEAVIPAFGRMDLIYEYAAKVVNEICRKHEVHFVTHRNPKLLAGVTGKWLSHYFDGYKGVHVLNNGVDKTEVMKWDWFIDDKSETVRAFREKGIPILVPARPWNVDVGYDRFDSWLEVREIL